jgi:hypothetical protein
MTIASKVAGTARGRRRHISAMTRTLATALILLFSAEARAADDGARLAALHTATVQGDCARDVAPTASSDAAPLSVDLSAGWEDYARAALASHECPTASHLVEQAIAAGDPVGFVVRAEMFESGRCAPRQPSKAVRDYAEAARHDYEVGYARLGYLVLNGIGVPAGRCLGQLAIQADRPRPRVHVAGTAAPVRGAAAGRVAHPGRTRCRAVMA